MSYILSGIAIIVCGSLGAVVAWYSVAALGWTGVAAAIAMAVVGMVAAILLFVVGIVLGRALGFLR